MLNKENLVNKENMVNQVSLVNEKRVVKEFCKLVSIDSISFKERKMADYLKDELVRLGFLVLEDKANEVYGGNAGNVYGYLEGEIPGPPILFSSHMDTVVPGLNKKAIVHEDRRITSDGSTILGADDLSGITAILESIKTLKENNIPHRSIEILFPIAEEVYIRGSEVFDYSIVKAKEAYVLDLSGPVGLAALKAPTLVSFTAKFKGLAAHAGFAPEEGIHAIMMAATAITRIKQGRIDKETTVNIGKIDGGLARNIVPETCILLGEVRSLVHEKALSIADEIKEVFELVAKEYKGQLEFETSFGCISYEVKQDEDVVLSFIKACKELGIEYQFTETFGGSDNNNFMLHGIKGIVIACGMNEVHSTNEYTTIDELIKITNIVMKLMTSEVPS